MVSVFLSGLKGSLAGSRYWRGLVFLCLGFVVSACSGLPGTSASDISLRTLAPEPVAAPAPSQSKVAMLKKAGPVDAGWLSNGGKKAEEGEDDAEMDGSGVKDPFEPANRLVFAVNEAVDFAVLKPVATTYEFWIPEALRNSARNFFRNLATPVTLLNDLLQGDIKRAGNTLARFALNSTIGFGGLGDPATEMGVEYHYEDFGQTLAVHGVGEGPYIVLPVLGPSTLRHTVGRGVDFATDPLTYVLWNKPIYYSGGRKGAELVSQRADLLKTMDDLKDTSVDYYATIRSTYRQNRLSQINNGIVDVEDLPDISDLD